MKELCKIKKIKRGFAYIEIERTEKCKGCDICSFSKKKSVTVPAKCDIHVEIGQTVEVQMPTESAGAASLLIYAIPLALMLLGALIGLAGEWWLQLTLAAAGLVVGLLCAWLIDRAVRKRAGVIPVVTAVVQTAENDSARADINTNIGE